MESPNKRLKTVALTSPCKSAVSFTCKGKSKIQEEILSMENEYNSGDCCGICFSEAGNGGISRGYIDSCNHYFCFVCITEWAKVESKCPLCKRRFSTIRRPPKPPVFTSERVVRIPIRDQVYHYFGNAIIVPRDPYSEVSCSLCHGIADESLLLLCDLCDSAAHTYCVGLGVTVPEGDWFCPDCTLLKDEHLKSETNTDSGLQISFGTFHKISANKHVSISDILQPPGGNAIQRCSSASSNACFLLPPSATDVETSMISNIHTSSSRGLEIVTHHTTKSNARTLLLCRNVHDRISELRKNWNSFRSGTLHFSSSPHDGGISCPKSISCISLQHSASCLTQQSTAENGSSDVTNDGEARKVLKAWKMMDIAKSIKQGREKSSIVHQASKPPIKKLNTHEKAHYMSSKHLPAISKQSGSKNARSVGAPHCYHYYSPDKDFYEQQSLVSRKQKQGRPMTDTVTSCVGYIIGQELASSKGDQTPPYLHNACPSEKLPGEKSLTGPASLISSIESEPVISSVGRVKKVYHASSSCSKIVCPKEKNELANNCFGSKNYCYAKSEIQSLVKLNLKLQMKDEKLEVDAFKEVARRATHSILAACRLEHPKPNSFIFPGTICSHPSEVWKHQKSTLMPDSCRECFYAFVKDMVNITMMRKKRCRNKKP